MSRATLTQLKQLGLDSYAINQVEDADKQVALNAADARIDSALATQFVGNVISPYPLDIIECSCVLASWSLLLSNGYNPPNPGTDTNLKARLDYWLEYLDKVSKGELVPKIVTDQSADASNPGATGPAVITASSRGYSERGQPQFIGRTIQTGPFSDD